MEARSQSDIIYLHTTIYVIHGIASFHYPHIGYVILYVFVQFFSYDFIGSVSIIYAVLESE